MASRQDHSPVIGPRSRVIASRFALLTVLVLAEAAVHAQPFVIDWSTMDGGGGRSAGGPYAVTGTIGQADAGTLSGGNYSVSGGFWSIETAVPGPGAPVLRITRVGSFVIVSWPSPSTGFQLEMTTRLAGAATVWANVTQTPVVAGDELRVTLPVTVGNRSFRLRKP